VQRLSFFLSGIVALGAAGYSADTLPRPDPAFQGKIDPSRDKSSPDWPQRTSARNGAPSVVLILLDDMGFGATATFGGPVPTPALDQFAKSGLRYNRFHVNSLCSPTRAALLSGRNDHEIGTVVEGSSGYPGYNSIWPKSAVFIAEVLKQNGYSTAAFGKWHNTPVWETNPAGPFVKDGRVTYEVNAFGNRAGTIIASEPLAGGKARIVLDFDPDQASLQKDPLPNRSVGPGVARLTVNGKPAGEAAIANFGGFYGETLDIGSDLGSPVSPAYDSPFAFTGHIETVTLELR